MTKLRFFGLTTLVAVLLLLGCGKKQTETSEETTPEQQGGGTPVDQATVGELTGKISFQGGKPKLAVIVHALNALGFQFGASQRRQQQSGENGNDRDDDQ